MVFNYDTNCGPYGNERGEAYYTMKKLEVGLDVQFSRLVPRPLPWSRTDIAKKHNVSRDYVKKVEKELMETFVVIDPLIGTESRSSTSLDYLDLMVLRRLHKLMPESTQGYGAWLYFTTGTLVDKTTFSRFLNHAFPNRGESVDVPLGKFTELNVFKAKSYFDFVAVVRPDHLKFGDVTVLEGWKSDYRFNRGYMATGLVPSTIVKSDLRSTYNIVAFCGTNTSAPAVISSIYQQGNQLECLKTGIISAISTGFLEGGDLLVLDEAAVQPKSELTKLEDWLWDDCDIMLVFLPPCSPELSIMDRLWQELSQRMRSKPKLFAVEHPAAYRAGQTLGEFTHKDIRAFFKEQGYDNFTAS